MVSTRLHTYNRYRLLDQRPNGLMRWLERLFWATVVAAPILKLWPESFPGAPAAWMVDRRNDNSWDLERKRPSWKRSKTRGPRQDVAKEMLSPSVEFIKCMSPCKAATSHHHHHHHFISMFKFNKFKNYMILLKPEKSPRWDCALKAKQESRCRNRQRSDKALVTEEEETSKKGLRSKVGRVQHVELLFVEHPRWVLIWAKEKKNPTRKWAKAYGEHHKQ